MEKQLQTFERNEYIKSLQLFLSSSKTLLCDTLQTLNWSEEATTSKNNETPLLVSCPLDSSHRVSSKRIEDHLIRCRWHKEGYSTDCTPLPAGPSSAATVVLDKNLIGKVILEAATKDPTFSMVVERLFCTPLGADVMHRSWPQTADRLYTDFTTDERRALYDYAVAQTRHAVPKLKEFSLAVQPDTKDQPLTREQLLAMERDNKRRRIRHRTAKVHTKSKNYSEVLREVINSQMVGYEEWVRDQFGIEGSSTRVESDKKDIEEKAAAKKPDMIWLDWDYRSNPHIRWKYILEKEKARRKKGEVDAQHSDHRKAQRDQSNRVRKNYNKNESHRNRSNDRDRRVSQESNYRVRHRRDHTRVNSEKQSHEYYSTEYDHLKYKADRLKDYKSESYKKHKGDSEHFKKQDRTRHAYDRDSKTSSSSYHSRDHFNVKVKKEKHDDSYQDYEAVKYYDSKYKYAVLTVTNENSDDNIDQSHVRKEKKRKTKKKRKHKHKKKRKREVKNSSSSTSDSSN